MGEGLYKYRREIDYIADFVGADIERNLIKIAIKTQDVDLLKAVARSYVYDEDTSTWIAETQVIAGGGSTNIIKVGGTVQTARNWSIDFANLDIKTSAFRDALKGRDDRDFSTLETRLGENLPRNISVWGGTVLTSRNVTLDLAKLEILSRSIGDSGESPANVTGKTALKLLDIQPRLHVLSRDETIVTNEILHITSGKAYTVNSLTMNENSKIYIEGQLHVHDGIKQDSGAEIIIGEGGEIRLW